MKPSSHTIREYWSWWEVWHVCYNSIFLVGTGMLSCGTLCSNKTGKEGATNTSKNVNNCQKHYDGQNKPGRQEHILYHSIKFQDNQQSNDGQAMNEAIGGKKVTGSSECVWVLDWADWPHCIQEYKTQQTVYIKAILFISVNLYLNRLA